MISIRKRFDEHHQAMNTVLDLIPDIEQTGMILARCIQDGGKILFCGNGGSAADAQHLAAEFVGRFEQERRGFSAIALTTDTSILSAVANDYGFQRVFARQVEALARKDDVVVGISTSGASENVRMAIDSANDLGAVTIGLLGRDGGAILGRVNYAVTVPAMRTARIQEVHIFIGHIWCEIVEKAFSG